MTFKHLNGCLNSHIFLLVVDMVRPDAVNHANASYDILTEDPLPDVVHIEVGK